MANSEQRKIRKEYTKKLRNAYLTADAFIYDIKKSHEDLGIGKENKDENEIIKTSLENNSLIKSLVNSNSCLGKDMIDYLRYVIFINQLEIYNIEKSVYNCPSINILIIYNNRMERFKEIFTKEIRIAKINYFSI